MGYTNGYHVEVVGHDNIYDVWAVICYLQMYFVDLIELGSSSSNHTHLCIGTRLR